MKRKLSTESVQLFRHRDFEPLAERLREFLELWAAANLRTLTAARPQSPVGLSDRMAEAWEPLLAIAELAGGSWSSRARQAASDLHAAGDPDEDNDAVRLLRAIHIAFGERDSMWTRELLTRINEDEELPFGDWNRGAE